MLAAYTIPPILAIVEQAMSEIIVTLLTFTPDNEPRPGCHQSHESDELEALALTRSRE